MLLSLSQEAAQGLCAEAPAPAPAVTTIFAKYNMKGGRVREIRLLPKTLFSKLKRALCACEQLRAEDVCVFFEGRELLPEQRPRDVEMHSGAVVSVIQRGLVYAALEPAPASSGVALEPQDCLFAMTVQKFAATTGAASSQALVDLIERPGWIQATPKFRQLAREFYGEDVAVSPAAEDSEDEVPLARLKDVREAKRLRLHPERAS